MNDFTKEEIDKMKIIYNDANKMWLQSFSEELWRAHFNELRENSVGDNGMSIIINGEVYE